MLHGFPKKKKVNAWIPNYESTFSLCLLPHPSVVIVIHLVSLPFLTPFPLEQGSCLEKCIPRAYFFAFCIIKPFDVSSCKSSGQLGVNWLANRIKSDIYDRHDITHLARHAKPREDLSTYGVELSPI